MIIFFLDYRIFLIPTMFKFKRLQQRNSYIEYQHKFYNKKDNVLIDQRKFNQDQIEICFNCGLTHNPKKKCNI